MHLIFAVFLSYVCIGFVLVMRGCNWLKNYAKHETPLFASLTHKLACYASTTVLVCERPQNTIIFQAMNKRCYDLKNLEKYENNPLIYERKTINNENVYNYKTIIQEASKCRKYLQKHQVKTNVGIAIDLKEHSAAACILLLGILNHECHFYCLNLEDTKDIVAYLQSSGAEYVISPQNLKLDNIKKHTENEIKVLNDDYFYLYYLENCGNSNFENIEKCYTIATSGSTGQPKIVFVPYECIEPNIKSLSYLLNIKGNDIIFLSSPPTFDPFVVEFFLSLENGASILITSNEIRLQAQLLLKIMFPDKAASKPGVTLYQTTPSLFRIFDKESIQKVILNKNSTLRYLILGGEDFPNSFELNSWLPDDFYSTGKRIFNIYGITEISCWASIWEFDGKTKSIVKGRAPLGNPLDNATFFRLVDEHGNILHHNDCDGELEIGSSTRRCYIPQCDDYDVANLKRNGITYRKTGDLVERDGTGNIYYIGRINNTIKRFGKRLCLDSLNTKVENILNANNMYLKVISLWHKDSSKLIFYIVKSNKLLDNEKECVINSLKGKLENHEQPDKIIYSQEQLPLNRHGKVDHHKILQKMSLNSSKSPVQIFRDFLVNVMGLRQDMEIEELNVSATSTKRLKLCTNLSFIAAGGNSFQALSLATEIAEQMEENIKQRKVLEMLLDNNVTIEDILKFVLKCSKKSKFEETPIEYLEMCKNTKFNLKMLWRCDLKKCIDAAPAIYKDKFVLVGSHSHLLKTVNALTGEEISCLELKDRIECPVVFANPQLALVGCYDGFLYGFDFNTGTILWHLNAKGMIKAKPLIIKNLIIIASYAEDYNIMAFDMQSLVLRWSLKLGSKGILSSPVQIYEESVLVCSLDGSYALIQTATGTIKWLRKLDTPIFSTATKVQTSHEILLVLAEVKGLISICKAETGESITSYQTDGNVFSGLTLHHPDNTNHSLIIFGCHDKNVYCLKIEHSSRQLSLFSKFCLNSAVYATPIVILKRYIVACSTKGLIILLDLQTFSVAASTELKAEIFSTPNCLRDKYIYVGSRDNYLYCFQIEN